MVVSVLKCRSFIQIIIVDNFVVSFIFEIGQINYGAILFLRAYRRRAQDSEVMVVSLLKCRSFIEIIIVDNFCSVFYF